VRASATTRRVVAALAGCAAVTALAVVGLLAGVDAGMFRGTVIRFISARAGRPIEVSGALRVRLLARQPEILAEGVTIGNPPWAPPGQMARIGEVALTIDLPLLHRGFGVASLSLKSTTLHLTRDAAGYANWQWRNPDSAPSAKKMPILRSLSIPGAHVFLDDRRRHLQFEGTASADGGDGAGSRLTIKGDGQLNGRTDSFEITGDPLTAARHDIPYHYTFSERSSGSELVGHGTLPKPFDFNSIDASFEASGENLKDLYFLTGVTLVNSGSYKLSGKIDRRTDTTRFIGLTAATGHSDIEGNVAVRSSGARPRFEIDLDSRLLKMADFGLRAAGRAPAASGPPLLLSNAALSPAALRRGDASIRYRAKQLQIGRVMLTDVAAKGKLEQGVLTVDPMTAGILSGKMHAHGRLDARNDDARAQIDFDIADLQLGEIARKESSAPPATGLLQVRATLEGAGKSVHQFAATANGTVVAGVQQGTVRDSLAEMTGVDLRGLGLVMAKSQKEIPLRCAVAEFDDRDGTLSSKRLFADTEPVLITGQGQIHFDDEALDLAISGHPKRVRLFRFRAPVLVKGTLTHPSIDVQSRQLTLVDPGNAKDADCGAP